MRQQYTVQCDPQIIKKATFNSVSHQWILILFFLFIKILWLQGKVEWIQIRKMWRQDDWTPITCPSLIREDVFFQRDEHTRVHQDKSLSHMVQFMPDKIPIDDGVMWNMSSASGWIRMYSIWNFLFIVCIVSAALSVCWWI